MVNLAVGPPGLALQCGSLCFPCSIRPGRSLPRNRAGARRRREIELRAMRAGTALVSESPRGVAGRRHFVVELIGIVHGHTGI